MEPAALSAPEDWSDDSNMAATSPDVDTSPQPDSNTSRPRSRRLPAAPKSCAVCGDTALAHNFGVLTCETCKAFFRRNASKEKTLQCAFDGSCFIDKISRRLCPACRLMKCFHVGMKRQLILDEDKKTARRVRRMEIRRQKDQFDAVSQTPPPSEAVLSASPQTACPVLPRHQPGQAELSTGSCAGGAGIDEFFNQALQQSQHRDDEFSLFHVSLTLENPASFSFPASTPVSPHSPGDDAASVEHTPLSCQRQQQQSTTTTTSSIPTARTTKEGPPCRSASFQNWPRDFSHVPREELPSDMKQYWLLTREERSLLTHLTTAYQDSVISMPAHDCNQEDLSLDNYMQLLESMLHKGVRFAKAIPEFQQLSRESQIVLLKGAAHRVTLVAMAATYIPERQVWKSELGAICLDRVPPALLEELAKEDVETFCRTLKHVAKNDVTVYALLHALTLLDPRQNVADDMQRLNTFRDRYWVLLKHHLESQYSYLHADHYLTALMDSLYVLARIDIFSFSFVERFSSSLKPLAAEMLQDSKAD